MTASYCTWIRRPVRSGYNHAIARRYNSHHRLQHSLLGPIAHDYLVWAVLHVLARPQVGSDGSAEVRIAGHTGVLGVSISSLVKSARQHGATTSSCLALSSLLYYTILLPVITIVITTVIATYSLVYQLTACTVACMTSSGGWKSGSPTQSEYIFCPPCSSSFVNEWISMVFETAMPSTIGDSFTLLSYEEEDATMRLRRLQDQLDGDGDDRNAVRKRREEQIRVDAESKS